ncbi:MAG: TonB-dependent receptor, partial [Pandoraea sp.]|uniref:TonB-dependent receptor plug domain-containing protein n=1 Tax=Pandoraea sp. TaxID=1883445 RepID=UPI001216AC67
MKLTALGSAIRTIVWAEVALTAALGTSVAFAQSQSAAQGTLSTAAAPVGASNAAAASTGASGTAAATPTAGAATKAATNASGNVQKLQRFEVTGSLIRSSDKVGFNQVQTVTAKQIEQSGASSVADFLRNTTANSANSWSEGQTGNFAAGAAGMALRGLSEKYTLVLVDGQRVAPFAAFSNTVDSFFDLNTLPLNDIERIEIVKTGAVSQYGSDAIGGVVNIITKHNFHGVQLDGSYGSAINGGNGDGTTKFGILAGFGNLNSDRFNVTAAASVYQSSGFTLADRDSTRNEDWTGKPGGFSVLAPSFWNMPDG